MGRIDAQPKIQWRYAHRAIPSLLNFSEAAYSYDARSIYADPCDSQP